MLRVKFTALCAFALLGLSLPAHASGYAYSHAAGFICGAGPGATNNRFVNGDYRAAFNVMNPDRRAQVVSLTLSLTFPAAPEDPSAGPGAPFTPGRVITLEHVTLYPGEAVMIDCQELVAASGLTIGGRPPYFSGVLDVRARRRLDVTLLQSAGPRDGDVSSYAVTNVDGERVRR